MGKVVGAFAFVVAALAPTTLLAQTERSSSVPRYHLMQLSVQSEDLTAEEFKAKIEAIQSCGEVRELAKSLGADTKRNRFVRASALPTDLQNQLADLSVGQATPVFSADGTVMRVLVLCGRN